jgi:transposase
LSRLFCNECVNRQIEIDRLRKENESLRNENYKLKKRLKEGYFGSSTPSSKKPVKKNAIAVEMRRQGGAKKGHKGHGRKGFDIKEADEVLDVKGPTTCHKCGRLLQNVGTKSRSVIDIQPVIVKKIVYRLHEKRCCHCKKTITTQAPGVSPKCLYTNRALAYLAEEYYIHGVPLNRIATRYGLRVGTLHQAMHRIAATFEKAYDKLVEDYRQAPVKHADETTWRIDGKNGYAWLFATRDTIIMTLRDTRSGKVAQEILGTSPLTGVLGVDRYAGYNKSPCKMQNCYAHLLRELSDIKAEFANQPEVTSFYNAVAPLLKDAMRLRSLPITDKQFYRRAKKCKSAIMSSMTKPANHLAIKSFQQIFIENAHRLYHWADDRAVPADNNFAERTLRPLVIARKISFGSQSQNGALTRSRIMSVLLTIHNRFPNQTLKRLSSFFDHYAANSSIDVYKSLLFQSPSHPP